MKTYKTWEMIKEIIENPKKKYRPVNDDDGYVEFKNNQLVWNGRGQRGQVMIVTETDENEWEEVKESQGRDNMFEGGRMNDVKKTLKQLCDLLPYHEGDKFRIIEECTVALEKQIAKKPVRDREYTLCPNCKKVEIDWFDNYCHGCGQRLDWSVEE